MDWSSLGIRNYFKKTIKIKTEADCYPVMDKRTGPLELSLKDELRQIGYKAYIYKAAGDLFTYVLCENNERYEELKRYFEGRDDIIVGEKPLNKKLRDYILRRCSY